MLSMPNALVVKTLPLISIIQLFKDTLPDLFKLGLKPTLLMLLMFIKVQLSNLIIFCQFYSAEEP